MTTESLLDIKKCVKGAVLYNEPMSRHTSFRTGGPAEVWAEPHDFDDLRNCIMSAKDRGMRVFIVGGGTNLLVRDEGIKGMVVSMTSPEMRKMYHGNVRVAATAAVKLGEFVKFCANRNLSGLEFLAGIPGTIGGAVMMNAGARHYDKKDVWYSIGNFAEEVKAMDYDGATHILTKKDFGFGYRASNLKNFIIAEVKFLLTKADKENVLKECRNFLRKKKLTQDLSRPSAGCVFKNPAGNEKSAGELIDGCGLKGRRVGGALISRKHANFIVNAGGATSRDIIDLINIAETEVRNKFGIKLELEIKIV